MFAEIITKADNTSHLIYMWVDKALEEDIKELKKTLRQLEKDGKIDFDEPIDLRQHPELLDALRELQKEQQHRWLDYIWVLRQAVEETMKNTYKETTTKTWELLSPLAANLPTNLNRNLIMPEIKITDTYITNSVLPIPWCKDGKTYSARIYKNVANFQSKLAFVLDEGINKGKGIEWMVRSWRKLTNTAKFDAERLILTEAAAMWATATKESYLDMGIEYVEIINGSPCEPICAPIIDEGPIPLIEADIGTDLPPYHPYCQCSFCVYEGLVSDYS